MIVSARLHSRSTAAVPAENSWQLMREKVVYSYAEPN